MEEIFIIEQKTFEDESWYTIFAVKTINSAEEYINGLKEMYDQHPEYGEKPQFQARKLKIY